MKILAPITENQDIPNKKYVDDNIPSIPVSDVKINNTSILSGEEANIVTNTPYNASTNPMATMTDIANAITTTLNTPV